MLVLPAHLCCDVRGSVWWVFGLIPACLTPALVA